ncbi:phosphotransferase [Actinomadura atramentaria]|uniref:phosphotransferase n=1 Tax=Actinomadura atramentaria TaxID=1990 RepID=UPI0003816601|nr:phosphotransferase [Actinomadura atramentaria]
MGAEWDAEIEVGAEAAARLIGARWPELRGEAVEPLGTGWDNTVFTVGGRVFRFPRRAVAVPLLERELAALPVLAPALPLPVPVPSHVARDGSPEFPWPFWGAPLVPGRELAALPDDARTRAAADAGRFLRALHDPALVPRADLPRDPNRRGDPQYRADLASARLDALTDQGRWNPDPAVHALLAAARDAPPPGGTAVCHGDLHARHLLVGPDGAATGVIDWGDVCLADPAVDLSLAYGAFTGPARAALLASYGRPVPPGRELAARVLAVFLCAALAEYAADDGRPALLAEALTGLARAAA